MSVGCDGALKPAFGLLIVALLVTHLGEGVLRVEANRWKWLRLLFYLEQDRFGFREIAALCEQLCFQQISKLNIEGASALRRRDRLASRMYWSLLLSG